MTERNCVTVALEGEFDISNVGELRRRLNASEAGDEVLIDCSRLQYIVSSSETDVGREAH